jgi:hypothetical protein
MRHPMASLLATTTALLLAAAAAPAHAIVLAAATNTVPQTPKIPYEVALGEAPGLQPDLALATKRGVTLLVTFQAACRVSDSATTAYATIQTATGSNPFAAITPTGRKGWFCLPSSAASPEGVVGSVAGVIAVPACPARIRVIVTPQGVDPIPAATLKDVLLAVEQ